MVCINGATEDRSWNFSGIGIRGRQLSWPPICYTQGVGIVVGCYIRVVPHRIREVEEYKSLGVTVKASVYGGFRSMGDANGVLATWYGKICSSEVGNQICGWQRRMEGYGNWDARFRLQ